MTEGSTKPAVYLDTNIFIFFYEGSSEISDRIKPLFDLLRRNPGSGVTSELTLAEVFAESERPRPAFLKRAYLDLIVWGNLIELVPISRNILYESAELRSVHRSTHGKKLDLPDAIHLSTAIQKRCGFFISADDGIRPPIEMIRLSPIVENFDEVIKALDGT